VKDLKQSFDYDVGKEVLFMNSNIIDVKFKSFDPFTHVFIFAFGYKNAAIEKALQLILFRFFDDLLNKFFVNFSTYYYSSTVTYLFIGKALHELEKTAQRQQFIDAFTPVEEFNVLLISGEQHSIHIYKRAKFSSPLMVTSKLIWLSKRLKKQCLCDIVLEEFISSANRKKRVITCSDDDDDNVAVEENKGKKKKEHNKKAATTSNNKEQQQVY
jgi:hypothetical protein